KKNNNSEAELYFEKALNLIIKTLGKKHYRTHVIYRNIGENYEEKNLLDNALKNYQKGLISLFPDFNSEDVYYDPEYIEYEKKEDIFYVLTDKSGALYKRFLKEGDKQDLIAAFELYKTGYKLLEELLNSGFMDESMMQVFQGFKSAFNMSIECAFDLYDYTGDSEYYDQAFQFMEKSRYFLLFKALTNTLYKASSGISNDLFISERQLTHDINQLKHQLISSDDLDHDLSFSIRNSLLDKLLEKDELWSQITVGSSVSTSLFMDSLILSVEDIQQELVQDDEIIIEYQWSENFIYALTIGKEEVDVKKIAITPELIQHINDYAHSISGESNNDFTMEGFQRYISSAYYLYQKLFEPVLNITNNASNGINRIKQITIVPDGMLSYLPFESLLTDMPDTIIVSYWKLPYLLNDFTFRYAYSLNILRNNLTTEQKIKNPKLLAFSYSGILEDNPEIAQLRFEEEIRYSAEELNSIKSRIKGKFHEDADATEELFKNQAAQYSLIHLALHGQADITDIYNSKLIFKDGGSKDEDGQLYAYELYNMDLSNTEMAVLSACETGIGQQMEGEGIFSIARGFAYAGCPSIFMSLWKVSDKTTAKLMDHFYNNLIKGMPKDKAMQKAK
ncbi:MAG: CHAT domain-containing protein, partial [Cyclobacteriaceae bacterium]|nr:CHAT domain-containing protein [Cyclobacteriaceae bacterium]